MNDLDPLFQILAEAIDGDAFKPNQDSPEWELRRRRARYRARVGIRIAQAIGWRFLPPGQFEADGDTDAAMVSAARNVCEAADIVERQ